MTLLQRPLHDGDPAGPREPLARLAQELRETWSADTSVDPVGWSAVNPAWGQCAITALLVQDIAGGTLLRCRIGGVSHYFNRLSDGEVVDLTREQFPSDAAMSEVEESSRDYVTSFEQTRRRYARLRRRLERAPDDE
jgi:hypothetical protein